MNPIAALAATAVSLDEEPISRTGRVVQHAISLSPTIFPITFAAIIGKFFRTLGLFWAERGIKLGVYFLVQLWVTLTCTNIIRH